MPAPQPRPPDPPELPGSNLFPDEVMEALTDEEQKFSLYTGERCPKRKREAIIQLLAEGRAIDYIRRLVDVHRQTVLNVANQFAVEIQDYERRISAKLKRCKWSLADRIEREVDSIPRQALGLTLKIVSDIEATDSGRASAIVEHVHRIDLFTDFPDFVRELEARPVMDQKNGAGIGQASGKNFLLPGSSTADPEAELLEPGDSAGAPLVSQEMSQPYPSTWVNEALPSGRNPDSPGKSPGSADSTGAGAGSDTPGGAVAGGHGPAYDSKDKGAQKFLDNGT
jgi:hypothetical protein